MKYIILIFAIMLLVTCKSSTSDFFETRSLDEIKDITNDSICYQEYEEYVDYHFPELGSIKTPIRQHFDLKYDTVSHYVIIINGVAYFKKNKYKFETKDMDSISISHMYISKRSDPIKLWEFNKDSVISRKTCPIPPKYLNRIKDYYFYERKHQMINVVKNDSTTNELYYTLPYRLY